MELTTQLKASGWHLTEEGIKSLSSSIEGNLDPRKIIDEALNRDLREIGGGALATKRDDATGMLVGRIVLQVQRVRNIAAPKSNEESKAAPRLLQLDLTDGQASLQALELEPVPALNLNVAPGTKIYFKAEKLQLMHGFLLLRPSDLQILGGRVEALYEKWDFARTMLKYARSGRPPAGSTAPPPWVAFGKSIDATAERNFKSLAAASDKDKPTKENDEFNVMRNEAIAVASKAAVKKVFGGGGQNLVDHNIKKILDKGYSKDEAMVALQLTRNNLERALFNLKRRRDAAGGSSEPQVRAGRGERPSREGKRGASLKDEAEAAKPAANATLFDFLTTKLPPTKTTAADVAADSLKASISSAEKAIFKQYENDSKLSTVNVPESKPQAVGERTRFENNVSSSFAAHRGGPPGRMSRGGGRNRPPRGGGSINSERGGGNMRSKHDNFSRGSEQTHGKSAGRNGQENHNHSHVASKSVAEGKYEQESSVTKDQGINRRSNERPNNRNGNSRAENGNSNNRRRQQGSGSGSAGASAIIPASKPTNAFSNNTNNDEVNTRLSKVVEETANLKLSSSKREPRRGGKQGGGPSSRPPFETQGVSLQSEKKSTEKPLPPQRQPTTDSGRQQSNASYSQLPNGYTYDPSKIMGFQSKETNEFAMSLLKSQGLTIAPSNQTLAQSPPATKQRINSVPSQPGSANFVLPNPQPTLIPSPPQNFGHDAWMWKSGDLCMAKYWDDGRYYEAEITAVSDNTCVVFFLGYGNHEEVLKSDILPITDSQNRPLTNNPQPQHQKTRFRGDRPGQQQQVYVPPHKREY
ncbi:tudor domain-containing protein 3 [Drosophila innubila]|uniref:tudor domain-containing protein 3 n=1 Tax=Drosophila innubila TaxID=198719 RepID=UPI00148DEA39|nr:tudor domain-containing protein 3 [Drosophila innubila]